MSFKNAFNTAKKQGKGTFTWNGKKYNTMLKGDNIDTFRLQHSDYDYFLGNLANDTGGWKVSNPVQLSYTVNKVPEPIKLETPNLSTPNLNAPQPSLNPLLLMFTNNDIKSLGFRNYNGLVNAVNNLANSNNNFIKALTTRYGADTSKWNLLNIEKDLGVKGTYRSFGGGDFGDMSRNMASWIGTYNGNLAKLEQDKIWNLNAGVKYSLNDTTVLANKYQLLKPLLNIPNYVSNNLVNLKFKNGGMIYKYLQGGQAPQLDILQLAVALVQAAMQGDLLANQTIKLIMLAAQLGDQQALQVALLLQLVIKLMLGSRKARLGAKLEYFKCGGKKSCKKLEEGDPITEFKKGCKVKKAACGKKVTKHYLGGWINKGKGIWNWDSVDRMNRVAKFYRGETNYITQADMDYVTGNPLLESYLHNVYKNSKLPNKKIYLGTSDAKDTNNMPKGADPNAQVASVPDSTNNYKGYIGIGQYTMLKQPAQQFTKKPTNTLQNSKVNLNTNLVTNNLRKQYFDLWTTYVKTKHPNMLGKFKNTMQNMGYNYNWNTGVYSKSGAAYRLNNGLLQTLNIYTGNWNNTNTLPGMV